MRSKASTVAVNVGPNLPGRQPDQNYTLLADYADETRTAAGLGVCTMTLVRWRKLGSGPPHVRIGRKIYYRKSTVEAWLATQEHRFSV